MSTKLAKQTQKTAGIGNGMRTATITDVSGGAITISVAGGEFTSGVGVVTSYAPIVGDKVAVFRQDSSWLILGPTSAVNGWQSMNDLGYQSGWTDRGGGFPIGQWRRSASEVQLIGELNNTPAGATSIILSEGLPQPIGEAVMLASFNGTIIRLVVSPAGALTTFNTPTVAGTLQFCCSYPLDPRLS